MSGSAKHKSPASQGKADGGMPPAAPGTSAGEQGLISLPDTGPDLSTHL